MTPSAKPGRQDPVEGESDIEYYRRRDLGPFLFALAAAYCLGNFTATLFQVPNRIDMSFPEGALVARAMDVAAGEVPYHDWREWPHAFAPYAPLTYYAVGWLGRAAGVDSSYGFYIAGRLVSLSALIGVAALMLAFLRRLGRGWLWAVAAWAALFAWIPMIIFVTTYRPDAPQVFFSLLALWIATGGPPERRRVALALACVWISMWFKPMSWAAIATLGWWIGNAKGWKTAGLWLLGLAAAGLIPALMLNALWDGRLLLNMIGSLDNGFVPSNLIAFYRRINFIQAGVLLVGVGTAALQLYRGRAREGSGLIFFACVASYVFTSVQNLKYGADINYYLEPYALSCVLTAWSVARLWNRELRLSVRWREALIWLVVAPAVIYKAGVDLQTLRDDIGRLRILSREFPALQAMRQVDGPALVLNPFMALAQPSSAPPTILDHVQYANLVERGKLDDEPLIERLREQWFDVVVLSGEAREGEDDFVFSPRFRSALDANYRIESEAGIFQFYVPLKREGRNVTAPSGES